MDRKKNIKLTKYAKNYFYFGNYPPYSVICLEVAVESIYNTWTNQA